MTTRNDTHHEIRHDQQGHEMAKTKSPRKVWRGGSKKRPLALLIALILPLVAALGLFGATAAFGDGEDQLKFSFYKLASSTTAFFSTIQEPGSEENFSGEWLDFMDDPGSAGSLLGYADPDFSPTSGWLTSKLSGSSDAIGYRTLLVRGEGDTSGFVGGDFQGMADYAYFGAALKGMGLDSTSTGLSLGFMNWLSGGVVMVLFVLGGAVDFVFNGVVSILALLNPFKLFYLGLQAISPELADGMVGNGTPDVGPLSGVVSFIGGWYQALSGLAWGVMVPLFLGVLIFSLLLFKKLDKGGAVKKFIVRLIFMGIGLPLLGTMYTGTIDAMSNASSSGNIGSARVVLSTYVDFEKWVTNSRLALPDKAVVEWNTSEDRPSGTAQAAVRNTALAINNQSLGLNLTSIVSSDSFDASWANQVMEGKTQDARTTASTYAKTVDVLERFMSGAQVPAGTFETEGKGDLRQSSFFQNNKDTNAVNDWFDSLTTNAAEMNEQDPRTNPVVSVKSGSGLRAESAGGGVRAFSSSTAGCTYTGTMIANAADGTPRACNMSPLAVYNYLNTDFGSTSMQMYSSANVASEATRSIHNSVNQVGTGAMSFLYWVNAVVLLGAFVLIGLGYAFSLLFASIRRSFQIITAVPFATIGAIAAIAKVIIYTIALILEVVVTIFIYMIVQEFLTSLPQLIEMPFSAVLNNGGSGPLAGFVAFLVGGWGFSLVVTLLSIIGVVGFTILAVRVRKSFVKAVEEAVTKLVEKFVGASVGMPNTGGGMGPALAGGLASGAGAVAASQMMNRGAGKGAVAALPGAGAQGGPAGVTTAGGTTSTGPGPSGGDDGGQLSITTGGQGAPGNGDQGAPVAGLPGGDGNTTLIAQEVSLGREVEANGLSQPDPAQPAVGDDAMSSATDSLESSAAGYQAADKKRLDVGKDAALAAGHGAIAAGRGFAGDAAGAAESGGKAVQHGAGAVASGQQAKRAEAEAGRSSLDAPSQKGMRAEATAQQVSQAGGALAGAAGVAGGAKGVSAGGAGGTTPSRSAAAPRPATSAPAPAGGTRAPARGAGSAPAAPGPRPSASTSAPTPQSAPAPRGASAPRTAVAPRPVAAPKSAVAPQAPRPTKPTTAPAQNSKLTARPVARAPRSSGSGPAAGGS